MCLSVVLFEVVDVVVAASISAPVVRMTNPANGKRIVETAWHVVEQRSPIGSTVRFNETTIEPHPRIVAKVFKGITINLAMVEDGQAFADHQDLSKCDAREYQEAEFRARWPRYGFCRPGPGDDLKRSPKPVQNEQAGARWAPIPKRLRCFVRCSSVVA
jgi:hypothetical protein